MSDQQPPESRRFLWEVNWKICAFSLLFLPVLLTLGFWQLDRAEEKRTIQQTLSDQQARPPLRWDEYLRLRDADPVALQYRRIALTGRLDHRRYWLLENQIVNGQVGYAVIMPLHLETGEAVLINRGWVPGTGSRREPPEVQTPDGTVTLSGWLREPSDNRLLRGGVADMSDNWPKLILMADIDLMSQEYHRPLQPTLLQLEPDSAAALVVQWRPLNMPPSRHVGYAVQWFAMALVLVILTLFANSNLASVIRAKTRRL